MLTNALIGASPITVELASNAVPMPSGGETVPQEDLTRRQFAVGDEHRSKTSVVASLLAAGYVLGEDAIKVAKEYDESHSLSRNVVDGVVNVKNKLVEADQKYLNLGDKASKLAEGAATMSREYGVTAAVSSAWGALAGFTSSFFARVAEVPAVAATVSTLKTTVQTMGVETRDAVEQQRRDMAELAAREAAEAAEDAAQGRTQQENDIIPIEPY
eukprot:TRINITY_DN4784_c0_g1_i2.p1 TRINITY_DN4784_c0_g1~~TRINITY_DN4784_c0_g1_i2.p1  ORF type:complete len:215 (-),score=37.85 TRINITY_DN4784_c0_g1_i2:76-720(-)